MVEKQPYWKPEIETIPEDKIIDIRLSNMRANVQYAYSKSPFYKKLFDTLHIKPRDIRSIKDFKYIPWISKKEIIDNQKVNPPFGDFLAVDLAEISRIFIHPGPECFALTKKDLKNVVDNMARAFYTSGVRKQDVADVTLNYNWVFSGTVMDEAFRKIGCSVIPGGVGMTKLHVKCLKELKTTVIIAFPTFLEQIGETSQEMGLNPKKDFSLRIGLIAGEIRTEESKKHLEQTFGMEIREGYGGSEVGGSLIAAECEFGGGPHIFSEYIWELIDPDTGKSVSYDEKGELVVTGLVFRSMPFLRYRTGDLIEGFDLKACPCGRTSFKIKKVIGRVSEIPRVKGIFVIPEQIENALTKYDCLGRFQLVIERPQIRDLLTLKVEYKESTSKIDLKNLKLILENEMKEVTRLKTEINLISAGKIPEDAPIVNDLRKI